MKSPFRKLLSLGGKPPIPLSPPGYGSAGLRFPLIGGPAGREQYLRAFGQSGTIFSIVSLLAEASAAPSWSLYKQQPQDGRVRYTTGDVGSDQRTQVVQHAALKLLNNPNSFHTRFEFFEGSQQHEELTGETFWVLDRENGMNFPTSMWYVRPDRMMPIPSPDSYLVGWMYTGPNGEQIPLTLDEVIQEKRPDPLDSYRGAGPVQSIMPNIEQQRYATEYQRNLFINGADPGGVIQTPNCLNEQEFQEMVDRWREGHQGVARAGAIGVLENGATWMPNNQSNKDLEYGNLRLANRDELREAWRIHKAMMGTSDDVNRANAETAEEIFSSTLTVPRLNRRRDTLNNKLLPMFGATGHGVEFDYDSPVATNREEANEELIAKANAANALVAAGYDPTDVLKAVGLPIMKIAEKATQEPAVPPGWVPDSPTTEGPTDAELSALLETGLRPYTQRVMPASTYNRKRRR